MESRFGRLSKVLVLLALLAGMALAQTPTTVDIFAGVGSGGGAYRAPAVRVGVEVEKKFHHVGLEAAEYVIPTGKADTRDGISSSTRLEAFARSGGWKAGVGESFGYLHTSLYNKNATHPYGVVGYDTADWRMTGRYFLPYGDHRNGLQGAEVMADFKVVKHLWLRLVPTLYNSYATDCASCGRHYYGGAEGGVLWRWRG